MAWLCSHSFQCERGSDFLPQAPTGFGPALPQVPCALGPTHGEERGGWQMATGERVEQCSVSSLPTF